MLQGTVIGERREYSPGARFGNVYDDLALNAEQQQRYLQMAREGTRSEREAAFRALIDDFRRPAMSVIYRTLGAADLVGQAEEVWQQTIFRFFTVGAKRFRGQSSVRTYFIRVALYAAVDAVRAAARARRVKDQQRRAAAPDEDQAATEHQILMIEALRACLAELSGDHAEAVDLYYLREMGNCAVCAARLDISKDAFMKRLERARRKLEGCIRRRLGAEL